METVAEYFRTCPTCGTENAPAVMRCACGALLAGVDLRRKEAAVDAQSADTLGFFADPVDAQSGDRQAAGARDTGGGSAAPQGVETRTAVSAATPPPPASSVPATAAAGRTRATAFLICPYPDCDQSNPPGSATCLYCNRPLTGTLPLAAHGLLHLPRTLAERYQFVRVLPARGAEAELLVVRPLAGGPERIAKVYRQGIEPRADVRERIAGIDPRHSVQVLETGNADGHAYEVMEFCAHGSLRDQLAQGRMEGATLLAVVRELAAAVAGVHAAGVVHRDLKPENVLVRAVDPLQLVLTDFGIASVLAGTQRFTSVARTLPYASPESLSGVIDGKSDYWALGMIVLEAATGAHPFAGLSDAVILHQLTTRAVDASAIVDRNVRKLVRGLLVRDPATRWGAPEVARWLAGDPLLPEPLEQGPAAGFAAPYRLGDVVCTTPEQLAVALATHWKEGAADIGNGQLLAWFRGVQNDHNVVRLMIELRHERQLHVDMQLLKLILWLAPGIPPVWRGESVALPAILAHASKALDGDGEAAQWLHAIYRYRVLETYAEAGNPQMADVLARWNAIVDRFDKTWKATHELLQKKTPTRGPGEVVNWDETVYGPGGPVAPAIAGLHARLLAIAYDAGWSERLRQRLLAEVAVLLPACPWLAELGDPMQMDGAALLVLESLLPDARKAATRQVQADIRRREEAAEACRNAQQQLDSVLAGLLAAAQRRFPTTAVCAELLDELERYFHLLADVRASGRSDEAWMTMRNAAIRVEPVARRMQRLAQSLRERLEVGSGWVNPRMLVFMVVLLIVAPRFGGRLALILIPAVMIGIALWRIVPNFVMLSQIRELAGKL